MKELEVFCKNNGLLYDESKDLYVYQDDEDLFTIKEKSNSIKLYFKHKGKYFRTKGWTFIKKEKIENKETKYIDEYIKEAMRELALTCFSD